MDCRWLVLSGVLLLAAGRAASADVTDGPPPERCKREDVGKLCANRATVCREYRRLVGSHHIERVSYRCELDWAARSKLADEEYEAARKKRFLACNVAVGGAVSGAELSQGLLPALLALPLILRSWRARRRSERATARPAR